VLRLIGAIFSLDTLFQFAASEQDHLSSDSLAEVLLHSRIDIAARSSYAWRTAHNLMLLHRQAAIDVLLWSLVHILLLVKRIFRIFIKLLLILTHYLAKTCRNTPTIGEKTCKYALYWLAHHVLMLRENANLS
jgi:hypothetical protein